MKEKLEYVSRNIKSYRAKYDYSQENMAKFLSVSRITYNDYETNPQKLKVETLQQIADILKCEIADFFKEIKVTDSNK